MARTKASWFVKDAVCSLAFGAIASLPLSTLSLKVNLPVLFETVCLVVLAYIALALTCAAIVIGLPSHHFAGTRAHDKLIAYLRGTLWVSVIAFPCAVIAAIITPLDVVNPWLQFSCVAGGTALVVWHMIVIYTTFACVTELATATTQQP